MAVSSLVAASGGGIKLVQRGQATSAGNTTITAINTTKAFIRSFSTASSGDVGTSRTDAGQNNSYASSVNFGASWAAAEMGAYIVDSTTITATGACRWEVVEFA